MRGVRPRVLDRAVRADARTGDPALRGVQRGQLTVGQPVAVERAAALVEVHDQQRVGVGVPGGADLAGQVQGQLGLRVLLDVPDQQLLAAAALVQHEQPRVSGDRRELQRVQALPLAVPLLGDGREPVGGVDADGRVPGVTVLGVRDREQPFVAGQRGDTGVVLARVEPLGLAVGVHEQLAAVVGRDADRGEAVPDFEARRVAVVHVGQRGFGGTTGEGLALPGPELVAVGVVEPPDRRAVGRGGGVHRAVGAVGDLAVLTRRAVPRVDLPDAAGVRHVDVRVGCVERPVRHRHARRVEAGAPAGLGLGVGEEAVGNHCGRVLCGHPSILPGTARTVGVCWRDTRPGSPMTCCR